eukprot:6208439-Pleurochrysis_carterae.AAC.5
MPIRRKMPSLSGSPSPPATVLRANTKRAHQCSATRLPPHASLVSLHKFSLRSRKSRNEH